MARLPTVNDFGRRQTPNAVRPIARISADAISAPSRALARAGDVAAQLGNQIQDADARAEAKRIDAQYSDLVREELYGENGYMYEQGENAIARRQEVVDRLNAESEKLMQGLSGQARAMAENNIRTRAGRAVQSVDVHSVGERQTFLNQQGQARIASAVSDAVLDINVAGESAGIIRAEIRQQGQRMGWSDEVVAVKEQEALTSLHTGLLGRMYARDPMAALEYLQENRDEMLPDKVAQFERLLVPEARRYQGRQAGQAAYESVQRSGRAPESELHGLIDRTEGAGNYDTLFGHSQRSGRFSGVRVSQMTLGQVKEFSSTSGSYGQWVKGEVGRVATPMGRYQIVGTTLRRLQEKMGLSDDTIFSPQLQDAMASELMRERLSGKTSNSAKMAALRQEWEGFKHVSDAELTRAIVAFEGRQETGMSPTGGVYPRAANAPFPAPLEGGGAVARANAQAEAMRELQSIADPIARQEAFSVFEQSQRIADIERRAAETAAFEVAASRIEAGESFETMPLEDQLAFSADQRAALRSYEANRASAREIETDQMAYMDLVRMEAEDPDAFLSLDLATITRDDGTPALSFDDMRGLSQRQANIIGARRGQQAEDAAALAQQRQQGPNYSSTMSVINGTLDMFGVSDEQARARIARQAWDQARTLHGEDPKSLTDAVIAENVGTLAAAAGGGIVATPTVQASRIRSAQQSVIRAEGLQEAEVATLERRSLEWAQGYALENGRVPTDAEMANFARAMTTKVTINARAFNDPEFRAMDLPEGEYTLGDVVSSDMYVGDQMFPANVVRSNARALGEALGRDPSVQEVVELFVFHTAGLDG